VNNLNDSKLNSFFTVPNIENFFDLSPSEIKVFLALRKLTYNNKNYLLLSGMVKDNLLNLLSKTYKTFKSIQRVIKKLVQLNIIEILKDDRYSKITFIENSTVLHRRSDNATKSVTMAPPIYISKEVSKKITKELKEDHNRPKDISKNSFILNNSIAQQEKQPDNRMNESSLVKPIKPIIDNKYIKAIEQLPEFKKYKLDEQTSIHRFIHKAKTKNIDPAIIDDYCRSIIFNKTPSNMKNPKYKPIQNIKNYSYAALFNNMSIYHKMDNPNFPFDIRTQDELKHEQRQKETIEKQTLEQQTSKAIENTQENFLTKLKYLQDLFKENFEALLTKAKLAVARIKNYNPLFVPEIDAVEELYNNHSIYDSTAIAV